MLIEALRYLFEQGKESVSVEQRVTFKEMNGQLYTIKEDGEITTQVLLRESCLLAANSIQSVIDLMNAPEVGDLTRFIVVDADEHGLVLSLGAEQDDFVKKCRHEVHVPFTEEFVFLRASAQGSEFLDPSAMIRLLRVMMFGLKNSRSVLASLDKLTWKSELKSASSGTGASKSSYGSSITQEVENQEEPDLSDLVVNFTPLSDQMLSQWRGNVLCFWEFDHLNRKVGLCPYGGGLESIIEDAITYVVGKLQEEITEDCVITRGIT